MDPLNTVFGHLDRWRHFPAYQLERRADIFFSVYMKGIIEETTGVALEDEIVPELPIKRDLIWPDRATDQSVKVDYALFARDRSRVLFVELKTDAGSRRGAQDDYLEAAKRIGFRRIADGIRSIMLATDAHQKYHHLATALARLGFLELPAERSGYLFPTPRQGLMRLLESVSVTPLDPAVDVIYVQPRAVAGERSIGFADFAAYVERFPDPLSQAFAKHLRAWTTPAGAVAPAALEGPLTPPSRP